MAMSTSRTFRQFGKHYRFAAYGAVTTLALAGGIALGLGSRVEPRSPPAADLQVAARADALPALHGMPKADAAYTLPADMPTSFAALRRIEREYAESAATTSRTMPYLADRWFELPSDPRSINALDPAYDWPLAVTQTAFPRVADRWYEGQAATVGSRSFPRVADRRDAAPATGTTFPRVADRWYALTVTGAAFPAVADRRYDQPAAVTAPGFPRVADRR